MQSSNIESLLHKGDVPSKLLFKTKVSHHLHVQIVWGRQLCSHWSHTECDGVATHGAQHRLLKLVWKGIICTASKSQVITSKLYWTSLYKVQWLHYELQRGQRFPTQQQRGWSQNPECIEDGQYFAILLIFENPNWLNTKAFKVDFLGAGLQQGS